eukprot:NODE_73_length_2598_cov_314.090624_g57_i0.p1 GENE.NODE_73_length_2598_cov_314.090624_g57_i0~~NODE_73_length_2598_cov_314.090624_g57_i0.p1  ORF type:complete len:543 (-),score=132.01 NODE_73_length_2598_cov_314.090624_g57_i0:598-2226(-)
MDDGKNAQETRAPRSRRSRVPGKGRGPRGGAQGNESGESRLDRLEKAIGVNYSRDRSWRRGRDENEYRKFSQRRAPYARGPPVSDKMEPLPSIPGAASSLPGYGEASQLIHVGQWNPEVVPPISPLDDVANLQSKGVFGGTADQLLVCGSLSFGDTIVKVFQVNAFGTITRQLAGFKPERSLAEVASSAVPLYTALSVTPLAREDGGSYGHFESGMGAAPLTSNNLLTTVVAEQAYRNLFKEDGTNNKGVETTMFVPTLALTAIAQPLPVLEDTSANMSLGATQVIHIHAHSTVNGTREQQTVVQHEIPLMYSGRVAWDFHAFAFDATPDLIKIRADFLPSGGGAPSVVTLGEIGAFSAVHHASAHQFSLHYVADLSALVDENGVSLLDGTITHLFLENDLGDTAYNAISSTLRLLDWTPGFTEYMPFFLLTGHDAAQQFSVEAKVPVSYARTRQAFGKETFSREYMTISRQREGQYAMLLAASAQENGGFIDRTAEGTASFKSFFKKRLIPFFKQKGFQEIGKAGLKMLPGPAGRLAGAVL